MIILDNNDIVALAYMDSNEEIELVFLYYLDPEGNLLWKQGYASELNYPLLHSPDGDDLHKFGSNYIISGDCYYPYPSNPNHVYNRPFFIMLDSLFEEQWILPFGVSDSIVGKTLETIALNDSVFMGVGMLRLGGPVEHTIIMYIDKYGNELGYKVIPNDSIGADISQNYINDIERINDSLFLASITVGIGDSSFFWGEIVIDTSAKIFKKQFRDEKTSGWTSMVKTFDNKYAIGCNWDEGSTNKDIYFYKINENLEQDTVYPGNFTYDSLCPYQIQSGTIDLSDCMVVTDVGEAPNAKEYYANLQTIPIKAFPNPASDFITFAIENTEHHKYMELQCFNIIGKKVHREKVYTGQGESKVDINGWPQGIYIAVIFSENRPVGRCKFIVK
ncbi:MAG: T9SS type A sorting domain-containing protein [Bacteroidales bacterium]|nr:T9SS type A sorting domain-containing protein [Bacteroidales bacterium]